MAANSIINLQDNMTLKVILVALLEGGCTVFCGWLRNALYKYVAE
jgi:hypothetical protein